MPIIDQAELSFAERLKMNYDHPDLLETDLLIKHIIALKSESDKRPPTTINCTNGLRMGCHRTLPNYYGGGNLIFWETKLRKIFDMKVFVDTERTSASSAG